MINNKILIISIVILCLFIIPVVAVPIVNFTGNVTTGSIPLAVQFTNTSTGFRGNGGWSWLFGDEDWTNYTWVEQNASPSWTARILQTTVVLNDGSIILMGGSDGNVQNDTWRSTDKGVTWTLQNASSGWGARFLHSSVVLSDDTIVLFGGCNDSYIYYNDTWVSVNKGVTWTRVNTSTGWIGGRGAAASTVLSDDTIVLMGGQDTDYNFYNDTWKSTDKGSTWTKVNSSGGWGPRQYLSSVTVYNDTIILTGGLDSIDPLLWIYKNDTWKSTDKGSTWTNITGNPGWMGRSMHTMVTMPDNSIILAGGGISGALYFNDVWRSVDEGITWRNISPPVVSDEWGYWISGGAEWEPRIEHSMIVLNDSSIVLLGGETYASGLVNDTWRFDPVLSHLQDPIHSYASVGAFTVALQMANVSIYNSTFKVAYINTTSYVDPPDPYFANFTANKTNFSIPMAVAFTNTSIGFTGTGQGWTWFFGDEDYIEPWIVENASGIWEERKDATGLTLLNGSIIFLAGDRDFFGKSNDVWLSTNNGTSWRLMNTSPQPWVNRSFTAAVLASDGSIILAGGDGVCAWGFSGVCDDVWRSVDNGKTWNEMNHTIGNTTGMGPGGALVGHQMAAFNDGSIIIMGGAFGGYGIIRSIDNGATWTLINNSPSIYKAFYTSVVMPNEDVIIIDGNSVWKSSDGGYTWTLMANSGLSLIDIYPSAVSMPDNSIVLLSNDNVIRSTTNGSNWSVINSSSGLNRHAAVSMLEPNGKIIVVGGANSSTNTELNDTWSFNPASSFIKNPVHTYSNIGLYTVGLIARNTSVFNSTTKLNYISATSALGTAFSANPIIGTAPLNVSFTDLTTGGPTAWNWSFGDGTYSSLQNPYHVYSSAGTYIVTLRSSNTYKSGNYTMNISVGGGYPIAKFTTDIIYGQAPLDVQFTDTSITTDPTSYFWDFGDGGTSTLQNPDHTYFINGDYNVTLTVTDTIGVDTSDITVIHVSSSILPFVDFVGNPTTGISPPLTVQFTDLTVNINESITTWNWSFGDGVFNNSQNPLYTYTSSGQYTVKLVVVNDSHSNYTIKNGYIIIGAGNSGSGIIYANFTATPLSGNIPLTVQFTDSSVCNPICNNWNWDLNGDGSIDSVVQNPTFTYTYPAFYSPKLIISNGIDSGVKIRVNYITAGTVFTPTTIPQPTAPWKPGYNGTIFNMQGGSNVDMANSTYLKYWLQNFTATGNFSIYGFALGMLAPIMHVFGFWIFLIIWALYLFAVWIRSQDVTLPLIIGILTMGTFGLLFPKESLPVIIVMFAICGAIIIYKVAKE